MGELMVNLIMEIEYRAMRGKADWPSALMRRARAGVRFFSALAVSEINQENKQ